MDERLEVARGDRRGDRDADRAAELLRGVEQPGGEPGLVLGDAGEAGDRDRDEGEGRPGSGDEERPGEVAPEVPVDRDLGRPEHAAADQRHPDRHARASAEPRVTSACDEAGERDRGERRRQPGEPGLERRVAEHLLHVQRADEDEREEARRRAGGRPRSRRRASCSRKIRSGISGASTRVSIDQERDEQRRRRGEQRDRPRRAPADLRRLRDRVDEQRAARRSP